MPSISSIALFNVSLSLSLSNVSFIVCFLYHLKSNGRVELRTVELWKWIENAFGKDLRRVARRVGNRMQHTGQVIWLESTRPYAPAANIWNSNIWTLDIQCIRIIVSESVYQVRKREETFRSSDNDYMWGIAFQIVLPRIVRVVRTGDVDEITKLKPETMPNSDF